ncbi:MAG TPA: hypothetical protein VJB05_00830 [archaeon]|nr:hypothetical protein [archaeon]
MAGTDSEGKFFWDKPGHYDKCPEYGTPEHIALGGSVGPVYEPPRWMEDAIREARRNSERLS